MTLLDRELSWLAFNGRVLQEAADPTVPLFERLGFLAIFSSNLDEFFRVRVASLRSLLRLKKKKVRRLSLDPVELLDEIHDTVVRQQDLFGSIFADQILPELARRGIHLVQETDLDADERRRVEEWFLKDVRPLVEPLPLRHGEPPPFLEDRHVYLAVALGDPDPPSLVSGPPAVALVPLPSPPLERFVVLETATGEHRVLFLDDAVRLCLPHLFPGRTVTGAWGVKLSRDAELHVEAEFPGDIVQAIRKGLEKRAEGVPARFLYDPAIPMGVMERLRDGLGLAPDDLVRGGRYHNLHDLRSFPRCGVEEGGFEPWPPVPHPDLTGAASILDAVAERDHLLLFPYHSYDHVVRFLDEAAADPDVEEIWLTVYRVSRESAVLQALLAAAQKGKRVNVFVEAKARFDEESNLDWAERLEAAGVATHYSLPDLKVHAKIALVVGRAGGARRRRRWAYLGTGNFNEVTARFYTDYGMLTADPEMTVEVERVFHLLTGSEAAPSFRHLMVAPFGLRDGLDRLVQDEIELAEAGRGGAVTMKLNALEDDDVIGLLQEAARRGVRVQGVVRGICRMTASAEGDAAGRGRESEGTGSVELRSIVDRYLEHGRIYVFGRGGDPLVYLSSADWMYRNLSRRVEVAFPVRDPRLRAWLLKALELQLADNVKARILDSEYRNDYASDDEPPLRSQEAIREWLRDQAPSPELP